MVSLSPPEFRVNFTADITYEDGRQEYVTKQVTFDNTFLQHPSITEAYIDFLNGCGFVVTEENILG
jgi:hypothetical protein